MIYVLVMIGLSIAFGFALVAVLRALARLVWWILVLIVRTL